MLQKSLCLEIVCSENAIFVAYDIDFELFDLKKGVCRPSRRQTARAQLYVYNRQKRNPAEIRHHKNL